MNPIIGKKVVLFELQPLDIPNFVEVHREDKHGYMQSMNLSKMTQEEGEKYVFMLLTSLQMIAFVVMTKEGKASRKVGKKKPKITKKHLAMRYVHSVYNLNLDIDEKVEYEDINDAIAMTTSYLLHVHGK